MKIEWESGRVETVKSVKDVEKTEAAKKFAALLEKEASYDVIVFSGLRRTA